MIVSFIDFLIPKGKKAHFLGRDNSQNCVSFVIFLMKDGTGESTLMDSLIHHSRYVI
mgnify:CR=1 FL=1